MKFQKIEIKKKYICPVCDSEYDTENEVIYCMENNDHCLFGICKSGSDSPAGIYKHYQDAEYHCDKHDRVGYTKISMDKEDGNMTERKTWEEFRKHGFVWMVNSMLHLFGWAICVDYDDDGKITEVYPARVKFRGFSEEINTYGYQRVSKYMKENADELLKEAME